MKAAVVGMGSIGARHARILSELGCEVVVVSKRRNNQFPVFDLVGDLLDHDRPDYVVIASATAEHWSTLEELAARQYTGVVLVEKPLFDTPRELPAMPDAKVYVGYNLRFHPVLQALSARIENERVLSVQIYVGQYLPDWRPGTDYASSYSASRARGGGVLRDLSHELDYTCWLFGQWRAVAGIVGHFSSLAIDSEDTVGLLMETEECPVVSIQMNYLDRASRREITINTDTGTLKVDLVRGELIDDGEVTAIKVVRDATYRAQHAAVLDGDHRMLCTAEEGLETVRLIGALEEASRTRQWIHR
ncbi:MAG: Gfo/Idh/MocA family oxidoreductase [Gammaproteobacteria bacterium]